ncbi:hypothetical protein LTR62_002503 [Meristemomyces frigidus]|uniref:Deacetylase sirtuin-type domain-containing protein n=1 Tax=Meristemomyces frigidus TaxID=1508187 RepID=A0AAN7YKN9_9PEZI|nr:hypothetical protein LTR62_002503 [Meristemomyces frigidus]
MPPLKGRDGLAEYLSEDLLYKTDRPRWYEKMRELSVAASKAQHTPFHEILVSLGARLHQHVMQNIDGLDIREPGMEPKTFALHGRLQNLRCIKNPGHTSNWSEAKPGEVCESCATKPDMRNPARQVRRNNHMRPNITFHRESVPEGTSERLGQLLQDDWDLLVIAGTSLKIGSCYDFARKLSNKIQAAVGCVIRIDPKAATKRVGRIVNIDLLLPADEVARRYSSMAS